MPALTIGVTIAALKGAKVLFGTTATGKALAGGAAGGAAAGAAGAAGGTSLAAKAYAASALTVTLATLTYKAWDSVQSKRMRDELELLRADLDALGRCMCQYGDAIDESIKEYERAQRDVDASKQRRLGNPRSRR